MRYRFPPPVRVRHLPQTPRHRAVSTYTYYALGNLETATDANGDTTTYFYDANERLRRIEVGPLPRWTNIQYEKGSDHPSRVVTHDGVDTTFTYDTIGRLRQRTDTLDTRTFTTQFHYDHPDDDDLSGITYPSGRVITYDTDGGGRVTAVRDGATVLAQGFQYHARGMVEQYTTGNGLVHQTAYDPSRYWVTDIQADGLHLQYDYAGDRVGNVQHLTVTRPGAAPQMQTFTYDDLDRLTGATHPEWVAAYAYDALGNRQTAGGATYAYFPGTQRLQTLNTQQFTYDHIGNVTGTTNPAVTYDYNRAGQLEAATAGGVTTGYLYDGGGDRIRKRVGTTVQSYHLRGPSGELLTEILDPDGTPVLRDYIYAAGRLIAVVRKTF